MKDSCRDLSRYYLLSKKFESALIVDKFDLLRDIGSLFVVRIENVEAFIRESKLIKLERSELNALITVREDSKSILQRLFQ